MSKGDRWQRCQALAAKLKQQSLQATSADAADLMRQQLRLIELQGIADRLRDQTPQHIRSEIISIQATLGIRFNA